MLKIKLARFGKKHQPHFRIVVNEAKDKRDGSYVALLGHYAPTSQPKILEIDTAAYEGWIAKGAQPTETVASLFKRYQTGTPFPVRPASLSKKAKAKQAAEAEAVAAENTTANETVEETPTAETPATETTDTQTTTE